MYFKEISQKLKTILFKKVCENCSPSEIRQIRTIKVINVLLAVFLLIRGIDLLQQSYSFHIWLTTYLFGLNLVSLLLVQNWHPKFASYVSLFSFLSITPFYAFLEGDTTISSFIFLVAPLVCTILFDKTYFKYLVLAICIVLFFYCNHLAGFPVFKDYVLVVGLIPTALGMVYFYDKLIFLENRNLKYIKELEFQQEEMLHFNHVMSHDLKAPLRSITSFTGFLSKDIQNEFVQTNQKIFNYILDASRSMAALIDELLELSKASSESYPFKEVDLNELLARVKLNLYDSLSETKAIISYEGLPIIIGNDAALLVVFQNLISNSIKYQPKDIADHFPEIELSFKREDKTLHLFIRDNGIGIPQKRINDLFQPFSRFHSSEDFSGSGLGLSICKKIMERHEGTIRLVETSSSGSCFELIFSTSLKENKDLNIG